MNPYSAMRGVKKVASPYVRYFNLGIDDEGKLKIEKKRSALSYSMNRNGMFVIFSKGIGSWEDMMSCYDCRMYAEQALDALKNELDGDRWGGGRSDYGERTSDDQVRSTDPVEYDVEDAQGRQEQ